MYPDKHLRAKNEDTELIPGKKVVWHVLERQGDDVEDGSEWDNTKLILEITKKGLQNQNSVHPFGTSA
jgi:hypothetical protein